MKLFAAVAVLCAAAAGAANPQLPLLEKIQAQLKAETSDASSLKEGQYGGGKSTRPTVMTQILMHYENMDAVDTCAGMEGVEMGITIEGVNIASMMVPENRVKEIMMDMSMVVGVDSVEMDHAINALPFLRHGDGDRETLEQEQDEYMAVPGITLVQAPQLIAKAEADGNAPVDFTICVVDTGYDLGHVDLPTAQDGVMGTDTSEGIALEDPIDSHGTHVSGTIGAIRNGMGVVGVNPDPSKFNFHIGKGLANTGGGTGASVLAGVQGCVDAGAKVISMSLGCNGCFSGIASQAYNRHYEDGVLIIAAAGNGSNNAFSYPASYPAVMSVAATNMNMDRVSFSQFNSQVEISGPGLDILSTTSFDGGGYSAFSGTSMATPHVAGVAALVWSYFPDCSNKQIRGALIKTAIDRGNVGCDAEYGFGFVQAEAAYDLLNAGGCEAGDTGMSPLGPGPQGGCAQFNDNVMTSVPVPAPTTSVPVPAPTTSVPVPAPTTSVPVKAPTTSVPVKAPTTSVPVKAPTTSVPLPSPASVFPTVPHTDASLLPTGLQTDASVFPTGLQTDASVFPTGLQTDASFLPTGEQTNYPTYSPTGSPRPPAPPAGCAFNQQEVTIDILTDLFPAETHWVIDNASTGLVVASPRLQYAQGLTTYTESFCLETNNAYTFTILDTFGDGICCSFGEGGYIIETPTTTITGGDFRTAEVKRFSL